MNISTGLTAHNNNTLFDPDFLPGRLGGDSALEVIARYKALVRQLCQVVDGFKGHGGAEDCRRLVSLVGSARDTAWGTGAHRLGNIFEDVACALKSDGMEPAGKLSDSVRYLISITSLLVEKEIQHLEARQRIKNL